MHGSGAYVLENSPFFSAKNIDHYGGEDCGSEYWYVVEITDLETNKSCRVKFNGHYQSHYGADFTDYHEVKQVQKTITVWE